MPISFFFQFLRCQTHLKSPWMCLIRSNFLQQVPWPPLSNQTFFCSNLQNFQIYNFFKCPKLKSTKVMNSHSIPSYVMAQLPFLRSRSKPRTSTSEIDMEQHYC
ncbi:hypothetical protein ACB092_06G265300 [Castanea dentata]